MWKNIQINFLDIYSSRHKVAIHKYRNEPVKCCPQCILCSECLLFNDGVCDNFKFKEWLDETYIKKGE